MAALPAMAFAPGVPPALDLALDDLIKMNKKDKKKAQPNAKKPAVTVGAKQKATLKALLVKGKAQRQAVVAKKRGMNPGAQAKANKAAQAVKGQTLKAMTNKGLQVKGGGKRKGGPPLPKPGNNAPLAFAKGTLQVSINNTGATKPNGVSQPLSVKRGNITKGARNAKPSGQQQRQRQQQQGQQQRRQQQVAGKRGGGGKPQGGKPQAKGGERVTVGGARF